MGNVKEIIDYQYEGLKEKLCLDYIYRTTNGHKTLHFYQQGIARSIDIRTDSINTNLKITVRSNNHGKSKDYHFNISLDFEKEDILQRISSKIHKYFKDEKIYLNPIADNIISREYRKNRKTSKLNAALKKIQPSLVNYIKTRKLLDA